MSAADAGTAMVEIVLLVGSLCVFMQYIVAPVWSWLTCTPVEHFWSRQHETEEVYAHAPQHNRDVTFSDYDFQQPFALENYNDQPRGAA